MDFSIFNKLLNEVGENFSFDAIGAGGLVVILLICLVALAFVIVIYIFQGIALSDLAKKNNIPNPWLAWIPVGNMYILGKLGFEVYDDKKNEAFVWVLLGCSAATIVLSESIFVTLVSLGVAVFSTWAYYNIFKKIASKNAVVYTVLVALFSVGGIILFFLRKSVTQQVPVYNNVSRESIPSNSKFCPYCGNKFNSDSKFCSKCGGKIE